MTAQEILKVLSAGGCWHLLQRCFFLIYFIETIFIWLFYDITNYNILNFHYKNYNFLIFI